MSDLHRRAARWLIALTLAFSFGLPDRGIAQTREDSNGVYQIITIGEFSPTDLTRIRQLIAQARQQAQARPGTPPQQGQPPGAAPRPGQAPPGAQPPQPPAPPPPPPAADAGGIPPLSAVSGTGFLVRGQRTVVSNNHVSIAPPQTLNNETFRPVKTTWFAAYLRDGVAQLTPMRLIARQAERDLAIFEAESDLPGRAFSIADYDPNFDIEVEAIGYPAISQIGTVDADTRRVDTSLGFPIPLSMSQLHAIKTQGRVQRIVDAATQVEGELLRARTILHTAAISGGNSGGPLVNKCNQVIGINTFTATRGGGQALFSVHTRELAEFMRAQSIQPTVATGFCLFPGSTTDYLPHIGALAAILLGISAVILARSKPQIVYQTAQRVSRVFSRPAPAGAAASPAPARAENRRDQRPRPAPAVNNGLGASSRAWQQSTPADLEEVPSQPSGAPTVVAQPQAPPSREVELVSLQGRDPIRIKADRMTGGRSAILGRDHSSDAVLEETSVSRRHAKLRLSGDGQLLVTDLGSANGTWRGDRNISSATFAPGEEVRFGTQRYRLEVKPPIANSGGPAWLITGRGEKGELLHVRLAPGADASGSTEWTIGRNENVVDIVVRASDVSSNHAVFRYRPGNGLEIADRNSSNGTWLRGQRIGESFVRLGDKETVQLGEVEIKLERA